jgi:hypothetical protein
MSLLHIIVLIIHCTLQALSNYRVPFLCVNHSYACMSTETITMRSIARVARSTVVRPSAIAAVGRVLPSLSSSTSMMITPIVSTSARRVTPMVSACIRSMSTAPSNQSTYHIASILISSYDSHVHPCW